MITLILGAPGAGKSAFAVALGCIEMFNRDRYKKCYLETAFLNSCGYVNLKAPEEHVVYFETGVISRIFGRKPRRAYECDGARFGLPVGKKSAKDFYPPYAYITFDEAQKNVDSRNYKNLEDAVKRGWEIHRHMGYDLVYVSQFGNVDKVLRSLAERVVYIISKEQRLSDVKYKHIQSFWRYIEFKTFEEYEKWRNDGCPERVAKEYCFDGDIRRCYDGEAFKPLWFNGREFSDYTKKVGKFVASSVASFKEFIDRMGLKE